MEDLKFMNKPYDTRKYEKYLKFYKSPLITKLLSTIHWPIVGFFVSLGFSFLFLVFNLFAGFLNLIMGAGTELLSFGFYIIFNTLIPLMFWAIGFYTRNKRSGEFVNLKIQKQKYLVNRLVELYNNRLKLLHFLEKDADNKYISEKEIPHIREILHGMLPKIESMKKNIEMHSRNKDFLSKFRLEEEGIYKVFEELKDVDNQISKDSRKKIESFIDDAYIFEAFDNLEKDIKKLNIDELDLDKLEE